MKDKIVIAGKEYQLKGRRFGSDRALPASCKDGYQRIVPDEFIFVRGEVEIGIHPKSPLLKEK